MREPAKRTHDSGSGLRRLRARLLGSRTEPIDEVRASRARLLASSNAARRQYERDLDDVQQHLSVLSLKLGRLDGALASGGSDAGGLASDARRDLDEAMVWLRELAHRIYPAVLTHDGLRGALADGIDRTGVHATLDCQGIERYSSELEAVVFFCCREALDNVARHAGDAATASVVVAASPSELRFEISDDGRGFDPATTRLASGLQRMTDSIEALGGTLTVASTPGQGATVSGAVPF